MRHPSSKGFAPFLPATQEELHALGWDRLDVLIVTGDAYVDHPSFGAALIGRYLESLGYKVGILPQPDWSSPQAFLAMGVPRLFVGVTSGAMDSMVNHYTSLGRPPEGGPGTCKGFRVAQDEEAKLVHIQGVREAIPEALQESWKRALPCPISHGGVSGVHHGGHEVPGKGAQSFSNQASTGAALPSHSHDNGHGHVLERTGPRYRRRDPSGTRPWPETSSVEPALLLPHQEEPMRQLSGGAHGVCPVNRALV